MDELKAFLLTVVFVVVFLLGLICGCYICRDLEVSAYELRAQAVGRGFAEWHVISGESQKVEFRWKGKHPESEAR